MDNYIYLNEQKLLEAKYAQFTIEELEELSNFNALHTRNCGEEIKALELASAQSFTKYMEIETVIRSRLKSDEQVEVRKNALDDSCDISVNDSVDTVTQKTVKRAKKYDK